MEENNDIIQASKNMLIADPEYRVWVNELSQRYQQSQIRAAIGINSEQLRFYWSVGRDIINMHVEERWGQGVIKQLSADLTRTLNRKGFSVTSLGYMKRFYQLYPVAQTNLPPLEGKKQSAGPQSLAALYTPVLTNLPPSGGEVQQTLQPASDSPLFAIPWSHHKAIIDKVEDDRQKALFFVQKSLQNQWGRAMLENMLQTDIYEVQGQSANNFQLTLPAPDADLARDLFKGTYQFGFTQISEQYNEAQLKNQLVDHIRQFLLELGRGFSFVGQEYHIKAAGKEKYIDLLFYIIPLHRYCVIEVKITEFDFPDAGQLAGYMGMVDDVLTGSDNNPCIGLLICRKKNNLFAKYALDKLNAPIGVAEYQLQHQQLPPELQSKLPTEEEIVQALGRPE